MPFEKLLEPAVRVGVGAEDDSCRSGGRKKVWHFGRAKGPAWDEPLARKKSRFASAKNAPGHFPIGSGCLNFQFPFQGHRSGLFSGWTSSSRLGPDAAEPGFSMGGPFPPGGTQQPFSTMARFLDRKALLETFETEGDKSPNPSRKIQITRIEP